VVRRVRPRGGGGCCADAVGWRARVAGGVTPVRRTRGSALPGSWARLTTSSRRGGGADPRRPLFDRRRRSAGRPVTGASGGGSGPATPATAAWATRGPGAWRPANSRSPACVWGTRGASRRPVGPLPVDDMAGGNSGASGSATSGWTTNGYPGDRRPANARPPAREPVRPARPPPPSRRHGRGPPTARRARDDRTVTRRAHGDRRHTRSRPWVREPPLPIRPPPPRVDNMAGLQRHAGPRGERMDHRTGSPGIDGPPVRGRRTRVDDMDGAPEARRAPPRADGPPDGVPGDPRHAHARPPAPPVGPPAHEGDTDGGSRGWACSGRSVVVGLGAEAAGEGGR
jgi:hypothetical protein